MSKDKSKNKTYTTSLRLSKDENEYLNKLSKITGKKKSECLRQLLLSSKNKQDMLFETREHFVLNRKLIYEINHIGNNINQITKNYNSYLYSKRDKEELFMLMEKIYELLNIKK